MTTFQIIAHNTWGKKDIVQQQIWEPCTLSVLQHSRDMNKEMGRIHHTNTRHNDKEQDC